MNVTTEDDNDDNKSCNSILIKDKKLYGLNSHANNKRWIKSKAAPLN